MTNSDPKPEKNKPKSLWGVMGEQKESADENETVTEDVAEKSASSGGKGLWGVMGVPEEEITHHKDDSAADTTEPVTEKGLWSVIESAPSVEQKDIEQKNIEQKNIEQKDIEQKNIEQKNIEQKNIEQKNIEQKENISATEIALPPIQLAPMKSNHAPGSFEDILFRAEQDLELTSQAHQIRQRQSQKCWYHLGSLISGILACLLSILSLLPDIYWKVPASLMGLIAVVLGLLAMDELRRRDVPQFKISLPLLGLLFGTFAMFAGPVIFTPWGNRHRATEIKENTNPAAADVDEDDENSVDISVGE